MEATGVSIGKGNAMLGSTSRANSDPLRWRETKLANGSIITVWHWLCPEETNQLLVWSPSKRFERLGQTHRTNKWVITPRS